MNENLTMRKSTVMDNGKADYCTITKNNKTLSKNKKSLSFSQRISIKYTIPILSKKSWLQ